MNMSASPATAVPESWSILQTGGLVPYLKSRQFSWQKEKSQGLQERLQRRRKSSDTPAPGDSTEAQNEIFYPASYSPPCSRTVPWSRHLFSLTNIPQLDRTGSFISEKGLDIRASIPTVAPLVQCKCQCSPSTPQLHPT